MGVLCFLAVFWLYRKKGGQALSISETPAHQVLILELSTPTGSRGHICSVPLRESPQRVLEERVWQVEASRATEGTEKRPVTVWMSTAAHSPPPGSSRLREPLG